MLFRCDRSRKRAVQQKQGPRRQGVRGLVEVSRTYLTAFCARIGASFVGRLCDRTPDRKKSVTISTMKKKSKTQALPNKGYPRLSMTLSIIAILLSASGWWWNYASSLPAFSPKVELVEQLAPGQQIHFKVLLENTGKTTAREVHPTLAFKFARADVQFEPTYNPEQSAPANWKPTTSDIPAGTHVTLYSTIESRII
jgi:hypothetical protein